MGCSDRGNPRAARTLDRGAANTPAAHPAMTSTAPAISTPLGTSPSSSQEALIPTTGTSNDSGATRLASYRFISIVQSPDPAIVPSSTT